MTARLGLSAWQADIVRHRSKYRLPQSRRRLGGWIYWIAAIIILGVAGWVWWRAGTGPGTPRSARKPASELRMAPRRGRSSASAESRAAMTQSPPTRAAHAAPSSNPAMARVPLASPAPVPPDSAALEPPPSGGFPRPAQDVFEAQIALDRLAISCGSIDGQIGVQTRAALRAFQAQVRLPVTGRLDDATKTQLVLADAPCSTYSVTAEDLARLQPLRATWLGKSQQTQLDYESVLELVAEKSHAHPKLIRQLNPGIDWANVAMGTILQLPDVHSPEVSTKAAFMTIALADKVLEAFDANSRLVAHFPCSIAQHVEKRPVGQLHVAVIAPNPNYTFDPDVFPESAEARQLKTRLVLPPGPNNPVGVAWIGLDKPGYGIHGTPSPEQVGRTESHGCFRLANWNVEHLLDLVWVGMPVNVVP